jgi:phosphate transport system ATP-binding protein
LIHEMVPALTIIIVTHNLGQARRVSDETMFFYEGHLIEHGPTEQVFNSPVHSDTRRYVTGLMG